MTESNAHFRSVLRGYDPAQVDQVIHDLGLAAATARKEAGERTVQVSGLEAAQSKLEAAQDQLRSEVRRHAERVRAFEEQQKEAVKPNFASFGERIGAMLELAEKEASEVRSKAQSDAADHHALADESSRATREEASHYADERRSAADIEASRFIEDAKRQADSILDDADRQAMARLEEAEAVYERARAKSATAAVEFESTLAARRDSSAMEFAAEVAVAEQKLAAVRLRSDQALVDFEQTQHEATGRAAKQLEEATIQGRALVAEAKNKAERIRKDSERELAAATQRRDSINAQLSNVRQMLGALGGVTMTNDMDPMDPLASDPRNSAHSSASAGPSGPSDLPALPGSNNRESNSSVGAKG